MKSLTEPWFRLAYVAPHPIVDNVAYQFYRIAPDGMMLMIAGLEITDYTTAAVEHELPLFWKHVEELAESGANRIVLTGVPVSAALGRERVQELIAEVKKRTGLTLDLAIDCDCEQPPDAVASAVFRMLQEALTNVAKHANATQVRVALRVRPNRLFLDVSDDGRGITRDELRGAHSLGLLGLRERALALGGTVVIAPNPHGGTTVALQIPLNCQGAAAPA